jgi:hypothetical protein
LIASGEADVARVLNIEAVDIEELRTVGLNIPGVTRPAALRHHRDPTSRVAAGS